MRRIALFARRPVPGRVKSRLSPALPPALACDLYRALLADALTAASDCGAGARIVYWADEAAEGAAPFEPPYGWDAASQRGADLGERLERAFHELLPTPADAAVVIGADCPSLNSATLRAAFAALDRADVVLGPASDGGYTLIGLRRPAPRLFRGVAWGTGEVLAQTLQRAEAGRLRVERLETLDDLDTPDDLARLVARVAVEPGAIGARTREALAGMSLLPR